MAEIRMTKEIVYQAGDPDGESLTVIFEPGDVVWADAPPPRPTTRSAWCEPADAAVAMETPDAGDVLAALMSRAEVTPPADVTVGWDVGGPVDILSGIG